MACSQAVHLRMVGLLFSFPLTKLTFSPTPASLPQSPPCKSLPPIRLGSLPIPRFSYVIEIKAGEPALHIPIGAPRHKQAVLLRRVEP